MCLTVPGRILSADGLLARVEFRGVEGVICLDLLPDARVGDYVIVHAGFAIQLLEPSKAAEMLSAIDEIRRIGRNAE